MRPSGIIVAAYQSVQDIRLPFNPEAAASAYRLHRKLVDAGFAGEGCSKVPAIVDFIDASSWEIGMKIGYVLDPARPPVTHKLPVSMEGFTGELSDQVAVMKHMGATSTVGGNAFNVAQDIALADCLGVPLVAFGDQKPAVVSAENYVHLPDISTRLSLQFPMVDSTGKAGTLALNTEAIAVDPVLADRLRLDYDVRMKFHSVSGKVYVTGDPLDKSRMYFGKKSLSIIDPSTAFIQSAIRSAHGHRALCDTHVPMNSSEIEAALRQLMKDSNDFRDFPAFPPPLSSDHGVNAEALGVLDHSLGILGEYLPFASGIGQTMHSLTFGSKGGLSVGNSHSSQLGCFTNLPSEEKMLPVYKRYGQASCIDLKHIYDVGTGDSVAALTAILNAKGAKFFLEDFLNKDEKKSEHFCEEAGVLFAAMASRIIGAFVVHTRGSVWKDIRAGQHLLLLKSVAEEAITLTRKHRISHSGQPAHATSEKYGMSFVTWSIGKLPASKAETVYMQF